MTNPKPSDYYRNHCKECDRFIHPHMLADGRCATCINEMLIRVFANRVAENKRFRALLAYFPFTRYGAFSEQGAQ